MDIFKIVSEKSCTTNLSAKDKDECLKKLADIAAASFPDIPPQQILKSLREREEMVSTGLEDCIAIPHARIKGVSNFMIGIAVAPKGVDFNSIDKKKTRIFFILIGPEENTEEHLKIMAQIVRVAKNRTAYREMLQAPTSDTLKEAFLSHIRGIDIALREHGEKSRANRKLFIIVLYEDNFFEDIIELLLERGITGAAVADVRGMRNILSGISLFSDFIDFLKQRSDEGRLILAIVDQNAIAPLVDDIEQILGDLDTHTGAMILALDTHFIKGTLEVI